MFYVTDKQISNLQISPLEIMAWVKEAFACKSASMLPHKTSITFGENKFYNTMPSIIPSHNAMGVKVVDRNPNRVPTIDGKILYSDYTTGELTHMLDAFWITNARTGAVCATAIKTLAKQNFRTVAIMGLGNTAISSLFCLLEDNKDRCLTIKLLQYKDHCEKIITKFSNYTNVTFEVVANIKSLIINSDVIVSCITNTNEILADLGWFAPGCLLVPVHTKGFQNCDLAFDKVFADDIGHVEGFRYFKQFKQIAELGDVIEGKVAGRENDIERIISYNIGISLHDIVCSKYIIEKLAEKNELLFHIPQGLNSQDFSY